MRVLPVMISVSSLILTFAAFVLCPQDKPAESTGLFDVPAQEIARRRQPLPHAVDKTGKKPSATAPQERPFEPGIIRDNVALVTELNTRWEESRLSLVTNFELPATPPPGATIVGVSPAEVMVQQWIDEGTASGHHGILYDNRDRDHSNLNRKKFPQLAFVEYDGAAKKCGADWGMRIGQAFNLPTFGNSSTAQVNSPLWRSNPRMVTYDDLLMRITCNEFLNNQMYCYPEHNDFDRKHGDVYPANAPYWVISQGSSGSDQPFMEAIALTLAALRPEVRRTLVETHSLMGAIQMLLRRSQKSVQSDDDYYSGKAHPVVFQASELDTFRMVQMAHELTIDTLPSMVRIRVLEEDLGVPGRDYFHPFAAERLFDTPMAVARVYRTVSHQRRMVVEARAAGIDARLSGFRWVVLQGDPEKIRIRPMGSNGAKAELIFYWHPMAPIPGMTGMQSNRIDIGVFADHGKSPSLPAFITSFTLANEDRTYVNGRIQSIDYGAVGISQRYVDPTIDVPKRWRDEYQYSSENQLLGWRRLVPQAEPQEFAADGRLIFKKDAAGKPTEYRNVTYEAIADKQQLSVLKMVIAPK
ncbi:MAG: hypothetical protein KDB01_05830 [Planctomycetaceae bacterium]|nr:hypothetical protein [Planctomycetaceae bacterium]